MYQDWRDGGDDGRHETRNPFTKDGTPASHFPSRTEIHVWAFLSFPRPPKENPHTLASCQGVGVRAPGNMDVARRGPLLVGRAGPRALLTSALAAPEEHNTNTSSAPPALIADTIPLPAPLRLRSRSFLEWLYARQHLSVREIARLASASPAGVLGP